MSEQDGRQAVVQQRPTTNGQDEWKAYWKIQGQPWRTEPEIDTERQKYLIERRAIVPDVEKNIYPFKDIKLRRADVEWLLATYDNGRGPVEWKGHFRHYNEGLDLRGAILQRVDLHGLPLECMRGGLNQSEWVKATLEQRDMAAVHLENDLSLANLRGAILGKGHLEGANVREAHLEGAELYRTHLEGAYLRKTNLGGALLAKAIFDSNTIFEGVSLENEELGCAQVADVYWNGMNITDADWMQIKMLGDDARALQLKQWNGAVRNAAEQVSAYQRAVRANRQLTVVLRDQGLNEEADHFAYRAQVLQRVVWRLQKRPLKFVLSWFLYLLAGYGYRPVRSVAWYVIIVFGFALTYFAFGHISPLEAFVLSLTSFHGRGFFPGTNLTLSDPRVVLAAFEAVVGLLIEISFIATFTQRFFGK